MNGPSIEELQRQLETLRAMASQSAIKTNLTPQDVVKIVNEQIDLRYNSLGKGPTGLAELSTIIEQHLEKDEIEWLLLPEVRANFSNYLASANGHELIRLFITDFKDFYENKTHSLSN